MDSFDLERLHAYQHKVFHGVKLSKDQSSDFNYLRKRQYEESERRIQKEIREEVRREAAADRLAKRELFQQQRDLLLLSRREALLPVQLCPHICFCRFQELLL